MTTFLNDGSGPVIILDHVNPHNTNSANKPGSLILIPKNTSRRFGKADEHAHFTVYTKQPKSQTLTACYEAVQNECGKNGNPLIKLSDLKNNTGETRLFTITPLMSGSHGSMVNQLPSMQRADIYKEEPTAHCSACNGGK